MRFVNGLTLTLLILLTSSCSTIRMRYEADYKVANDEQNHHVVFERSYKVGTPRWVCMFTFWIYGGGCWYYLAMPTDGQEQKLEKNAREKLAVEWKTQNIYLFNDKIERMSWDKGKDKMYLSTAGKKTTTPMTSEKKIINKRRKKEKKKDNLEGFIQ